jgi:hypothetical protein
VTQLTAVFGGFDKHVLHLNGRMLLVRYPEGDCDSIVWPFGDNDRRNLASALFDAYETGDLAERTVLLPDGTEFDIDSNLA